MEEGDNIYVSGSKKICGIKETRGEGEERGGEGEGTKGRGSGKTTRGEKPGKGDAVAGVREREGEGKKGESSWKVTSAKVI